MFWPKCIKNVNAFVRIESHARCLKRFRKEKKRIIMYISSNSWFERYQADTGELDSRITTHNHAYPYLLTIVDHLSK